MPITAAHIADAINRLELTTVESDGLDEFMERYGIDEDAMKLIVEMGEANLSELTDALIKDLSARRTEDRMHIPAFLAGTQLSAFVLGYVTCLLAEQGDY